MTILTLPILDIKPYQNNPRKNKDAVKYVASSIKEFGFRQPIVIDRNNTIVAGHTRLEAAKQLKLKEVPCVMADDLTDEQIKAYRLVDNRVAEKSKWDVDLLKIELSEIEIDMEQFDFNLDDIFSEKPSDYKQTKNLDNFFRSDFEFGANEWGIPETKPFTGDLTGIEWVSFGEKASIKNPENIGLTTFIDDYKFNVLWTMPDKWIELLKSCKAVITPDFSNYTDMPKAQQLWNQYRRQWCARYWQDLGVNVISSLSWANGQIESWSFAGIPQGTTCATSFVGDNIDKQGSVDELKQVLDLLKPCKLFIKANSTDEAELRKHFDFEAIPPYSFRR